MDSTARRPVERCRPEGLPREGAAPCPPNGFEVRGRGSNPAAAGAPYSRAINEDVGGDWPRATSVFRAKREIRRCSEASSRRRSRARGGRRKRERDPRGARQAECLSASRSRRLEPEPTPGSNRPECPKIGAGSPFPWTELFGGVIFSHDGDLPPPPAGAIHPPRVGPAAVGSRLRSRIRRRQRAAVRGRPAAVPSPRGGPNTQEITASSRTTPAVERRRPTVAGAAANRAKTERRRWAAAATPSPLTRTGRIRWWSTQRARQLRRPMRRDVAAPIMQADPCCSRSWPSGLSSKPTARSHSQDCEGPSRAAVTPPTRSHGEATPKSESSRPAPSPQHRVRRTALR